jgi:hypothetical protein
MTSTAVEFAQFATKYSRDAQVLRRDFPPKTLQALLEVVDELAQDPTRYPHRTRPISRDGKIFLYTHPEPSLEITYEIDSEKQIIYFLHFAAPMLQFAKPLFVSYSHADEEWLRELREWLQPLEQRQLIKIWVDTEIKPGTEWEKEIEKSLAAAKAALLLVSDNFIASKFIATKELPKLLQAAQVGGVLILWLAVRKITKMNAEIGKYQALYDPKIPLDSLEPAARREALAEILEKMKKLVDA